MPSTLNGLIRGGGLARLESVHELPIEVSCRSFEEGFHLNKVEEDFASYIEFDWDNDV
ncbi:hypothetical protein EV356DRAFT_501415 [Viridothelium virens]|uniref:Uncharacterized protein n=1 Tax=Viridothelium virens TaxID=1048519 RepID=A0A6A6H8V3_VIRVR|nr:hypothetical protein EV356DRAFT_501415 [Viridothelium virens]